jgi:hypothetical protein
MCCAGTGLALVGGLKLHDYADVPALPRIRRALDVIPCAGLGSG